MKKTLAILLALIMSASVALVSCEKAEEPADDDDDFVIDFAGADDNDPTEAPETDENGETVKPSGNNSGSNGNNSSSSNNTTTMTVVNDTVYVLYKAKIRESAKATAKVLCEVPFGATVSRAEKNSKWSKVTYEGHTGYIMNDLVTTNVDTITFEDQGVAGEGENAAKVYPTSKLVGTDKYRLRYYPLAPGYPNNLVLLSKDDLGQYGQILGGTEVTVLEVSKDKMWAKVSCTKVDVDVNGEYKGNYTSTATGYIPYEFLEIGANSGNSGSNDGPGAAG